MQKKEYRLQHRRINPGHASVVMHSRHVYRQMHCNQACLASVVAMSRMTNVTPPPVRTTKSDTAQLVPPRFNFRWRRDDPGAARPSSLGHARGHLMQSKSVLGPHANPPHLSPPAHTPGQTRWTTEPGSSERRGIVVDVGPLMSSDGAAGERRPRCAAAPRRKQWRPALLQWDCGAAEARPPLVPRRRRTRRSRARHRDRRDLDRSRSFPADIEEIAEERRRSPHHEGGARADTPLCGSSHPWTLSDVKLSQSLARSAWWSTVALSDSRPDTWPAGLIERKRVVCDWP